MAECISYIFVGCEGNADHVRQEDPQPYNTRQGARAALALRYGEREEGQPPAPISADS